tara:strand:+ start:17783 stop:18664 length:882 start_codon:yes stop_codon:yes gene_type:complete
LKPNFFIVGAPKCGTTSLHTYLKSHSKVLMSDPKEPHYFSTDIDNGGIRNYKKYLTCFSYKKGNPTAVGESSTLYLYSKIAIKKILNYYPEAKFIIMLRNPSKIAPSFHQVSLKVFGETEVDFSTAWSLQEKRKLGMGLPGSCIDKQLFLYGEIAKIGLQVERLMSIVPHDKIHFILFDDFKSSTKKEYLKILKFLNLKSETLPNFKNYNATQKIKNPILTKITNQVVSLKKNIGITRGFGLAKKIHKINIKNSPLPKLSLDTILKMDEYFKEDINLLSRLLNRDLSHWRISK